MGKKKRKNRGWNPREAGLEKLEIWKRRLRESDDYWAAERDRMDHREALLKGERKLKPLVPGDTKKDGGYKETSHVRNIMFELIESQISSEIPQPKVTPRRKQDEPLAELIERFLRNELDRQPFESMNDMAERTVPVQGGVGWQVNWDNRKRTHRTIGEANVDLIHPKQFAPQPGIYTGVEDMDWFIVKVPSTKEAVLRRYGKQIWEEAEAEPQIRSSGNEDTAPDAVTVYVGYEQGESGINKYVWVADTCLEDLPDYQARRQPACKNCGRVKPLPGQLIYGEQAKDPVPGTIRQERREQDIAGHEIAAQLAAAYGQGVEPGVTAPGITIQEDPEPEVRYDGGPCPWCGCGEFMDQQQEYEQVLVEFTTRNNLTVPGATPGYDEQHRPVMRPTLIPFYKPDIFPVVLQRSVSVYGQLMGTSDVDVIEDQQNTINRLEQRIIDRLMKAGTRVTLPSRADMKLDTEDGEIWYLKNPAEKSMIDVYSFSGELNYEITYLGQVYEEARQILGITDSFQGRKDTTATSGTAKQFAAAQTAGRLESKRTMKQASYARIFELIFKHFLAYADEPRPISYKDFRGVTQYDQFSRYDFLERDEDGQYYWNDMFLFSCDTSAPLASNREAMWQETRMNLQTGAFGDPKATDTLILFWQKMELLHYPGAAETKTYLEERRKQEQDMQLQMMHLQTAQLPAAPAGNPVVAQQMQNAPIPGVI